MPIHGSVVHSVVLKYSSSKVCDKLFVGSCNGEAPTMGTAGQRQLLYSYMPTTLLDKAIAGRHHSGTIPHLSTKQYYHHLQYTYAELVMKCTPSGPGMEGYMDTFRSRYGGLHGHLQVQVWRATWTPSGPDMEGYMDTFRSRYGGLHGHLQVQVWRATWTPSGPGMEGCMDTFRSRYGGLHGHLQVQIWRATWTPSGPGMEGYMDTFNTPMVELGRVYFVVKCFLMHLLMKPISQPN